MQCVALLYLLSFPKDMTENLGFFFSICWYVTVNLDNFFSVYWDLFEKGTRQVFFVHLPAFAANYPRSKHWNFKAGKSPLLLEVHNKVTSLQKETIGNAFSFYYCNLLTFIFLSLVTFTFVYRMGNSCSCEVFVEPFSISVPVFNSAVAFIDSEEFFRGLT